MAEATVAVTTIGKITVGLTGDTLTAEMISLLAYNFGLAAVPDSATVTLTPVQGGFRFDATWTKAPK